MTSLFVLQKEILIEIKTKGLILKYYVPGQDMYLCFHRVQQNRGKICRGDFNKVLYS